jgi:hyperosmotically inducible protein
MRLHTLPLALLATISLAIPACSRSNNNTAVHDTRPDAAANSRAAGVSNGTDNPEGAAAGRTVDQADTRTAGTAGRTAPDVAAPAEDGTITMKIQSKYASDNVIKGRNIDVDTDKGVVTLKGQVDTARERDQAEQLARETEGVKRVVNQLKVATH